MSDDFFDDIGPKEAYEIGVSIGRYDAEVEAGKAFEMGEIELWIEFTTPKTWEEWEDWDGEYGEDFGKRWKEDNNE